VSVGGTDVLVGTAVLVRVEVADAGTIGVGVNVAPPPVMRYSVPVE
jgi:hypothetical protein